MCVRSFVRSFVRSPFTTDVTLHPFVHFEPSYFTQSSVRRTPQRSFNSTSARSLPAHYIQCVVTSLNACRSQRACPPSIRRVAQSVIWSRSQLVIVCVACGAVVTASPAKRRSSAPTPRKSVGVGWRSGRVPFFQSGLTFLHVSVIGR